MLQMYLVSAYFSSCLQCPCPFSTQKYSPMLLLLYRQHLVPEVTGCSLASPAFPQQRLCLYYTLLTSAGEGIRFCHLLLWSPLGTHALALLSWRGRLFSMVLFGPLMGARHERHLLVCSSNELFSHGLSPLQKGNNFIKASLTSKGDHSGESRSLPPCLLFSSSLLSPHPSCPPSVSSASNWTPADVYV